MQALTASASLSACFNSRCLSSVAALTVKVATMITPGSTCQHKSFSPDSPRHSFAAKLHKCCCKCLGRGPDNHLMYVHCTCIT